MQHDGGSSCDNSNSSNGAKQGPRSGGAQLLLLGSPRRVNQLLFTVILVAVAAAIFTGSRVGLAAHGVLGGAGGWRGFHSWTAGESDDGSDRPLFELPGARPCRQQQQQQQQDVGDMTDDDLYAVGGGNTVGAGLDGVNGDGGLSAEDGAGMGGIHVHRNVCLLPGAGTVHLLPRAHPAVEQWRLVGVGAAPRRVIEHSGEVFLHRNWCNSHAYGRGISAWHGASRLALLRGDRAAPLPLVLGRDCGHTGGVPVPDALWAAWITASFQSAGAAAAWRHELERLRHAQRVAHPPPPPGDAAGKAEAADDFVLLAWEETVAPDAPLRCFTRVLEWHNTWMWFPSLHAAHSLRTGVWLGDGMPSEVARVSHLLGTPFSKQQRLRVVVLSDPGPPTPPTSRTWTDEVATLIKEKFSSVVTLRLLHYTGGGADPSAVTTLLQGVATADVLIGAHHIALASMVAMPPGGVVVEASPFGERSFALEELARELLLHHVTVESRPAPHDCCGARDGKFAYFVGEGVIHNEFQQTAAANSSSCGACRIAAEASDWYYAVKSALSTVWLRNSRLSDVHAFDVRR